MEIRIPLSKKGFTFVELILVTGLLAIMGLTVYGTFANGMSIWQTITEDTHNEDISLFLDKFSYDIRNSFKLTGIRFNGEGNKVSFPALMRYKNRDELKDTIGEISYFLDRRKNALIREEANYSDVFRKKAGTKKIMAENVKSLKFSYFIYDEQRKAYSWESFWQNRDETFGIQLEERLPLIVRVKVETSVEGDDYAYVKTVRVPSGCCWPFLEDQ